MCLCASVVGSWNKYVDRQSYIITLIVIFLIIMIIIIMSLVTKY